MGNTRQPPRRWELSPDEMERIVAARSRPLGSRELARLLTRSPALIPEIVRAGSAAARQALRANNALVSLIDSERARSAVPDAASGVGWYDEEPFLAVLLPMLQADMSVLELGCGGGRISRHVAPRVAQLTCTDASQVMVTEASQNLADQSNVHVAKTDGFTLTEFPDDAFDLVFAQGVLGYLIPNHLLALLDEAHRVLRPSGHCVFNCSTIDHPEDARAQLELVRISARKRRFGASAEQAYTIAELRSMCAVANLKVEQPDTAHGGVRPRGRVIFVATA